MRFTVTTILLAVIILAATAVPADAQEEKEEIQTQRLAQTGMKFLSVSIDPRAAAIGDAVTAEEGGAESIFYNPAGVARMEQNVHVSVANVDWISTHEYNAGAIAFKPANGQYGVVGLSLRSVDYGEFLGTIRADNQQGYRDVGTYSPSSTALGLSYGRTLTDRFSVGANVKWVRENLGEHAMDVSEEGEVTSEQTALSAYAVDFGVIYRTGFRDLNFAANLRNFAGEQQYHEEEFELPLTFRIGVSMDVTGLTELDQETHSVRVAVDAERPRDYYEQVKFGGEYTFRDFLSLRAGYTYPTDEQSVSLGGGINFEEGGLQAGVDYAYTNFGVLDQVHRIGLNIGF